jgi:hypothetical protein
MGGISFLVGEVQFPAAQIKGRIFGVSSDLLGYLDDRLMNVAMGPTPRNSQGEKGCQQRDSEKKICGWAAAHAVEGLYVLSTKGTDQISACCARGLR